MAVWPGTSLNMTADGANNLLLNVGTGYGEHETASQDTTTLDYHYLDCRFEWAKDGATDSDLCYIELEMNWSVDNAVWAGWTRFNPMGAYFRYYKMRVKVFDATVDGAAPKITAFEPIAKLFHGQARQPSVISSVAALPGAPKLGARHHLTTDNSINECIDSDTPTWEKTLLQEGMHFWDEAAHLERIMDNSGVQYPYCLQGRKPLGSAIEVNVANVAPQTVLSIAWAAGTYDEEFDEFFVKISLYTGIQAPPIAGDLAVIQINDSVGGWTTVWSLATGSVNDDVLHIVHIWRGMSANTEVLAREANVGAQNATRTTLAATWLAAATGIRVLAQGDTNALCGASIFIDRNI